MNTPKMPDRAAGERARASSSGRIRKNIGLKEKAKRGHYGDLRLLGLSAGLVLLIIVNGLFHSTQARSKATNITIEEAVVFGPEAFAATEEETGIANNMLDESAYSTREPDDSSTTDPAKKAPEQRKQLMRETAENVSESETIRR